MHRYLKSPSHPSFNQPNNRFSTIRYTAPSHQHAVSNHQTIPPFSHGVGLSGSAQTPCNAIEKDPFHMSLPIRDSGPPSPRNALPSTKLSDSESRSQIMQHPTSDPESWSDERYTLALSCNDVDVAWRPLGRRFFLSRVQLVSRINYHQLTQQKALIQRLT